MNKIILIVLIFFFVFTTSAQDTEFCKKTSIDAIGLLQRGQSDSLWSLFDATMQKAITPEQIGLIWPAFLENDGAFLRYESQREKEFQGYKIIETNLVFEQKGYTMRLSFNKEAQISGLFFVPIRTAKPSDNQIVDGQFFREEPINIKSGTQVLPGTICIPKNQKSYPLVVFVHGSGPQDRDETIGPNKVFMDLAHALAEKGIGSIRYDKRTFLIQNGDTSFTANGLNEVVIEDARAAIDLALRTVPQDDKVFVIGHSLGASLAPKIVQTYPQLGGIVMMAASAFPIEDEVLRQTKYLLKKDGFKCSERKIYKDMKMRVKNVKKLDEFLALKIVPELPLTNDTSIWRDFSKMTTAQDMISLRMPVFVIQGERDYQVTMKSYEKLFEVADSKKNIEFKSYPLLNHIFHEGQGKSYPDEYKTKGNIPPYVVSDISLWILSKN